MRRMRLSRRAFVTGLAASAVASSRAFAQGSGLPSVDAEALRARIEALLVPPPEHASRRIALK